MAAVVVSQSRASEDVDLYARGWEAGYLAAHRDLTNALLQNPAMNGRGLARLMVHLSRAASRSAPRRVS